MMTIRPAGLYGRRNAFLLLSTILAGGGLGSTAQAQEAAQPSTDIVVTGSRLVRTDLTAPSPISVMGSEDVKLSGNVTLEKTLNEMPQLASGNTSTVNNGGGSGVLTANLRGLGNTRTLVLVNGRRFIPADSNGNVDLASIPDALIKRVEIITGGASAVYGSDAIAGAVNFILDDKFEGVEASAQYGISDRGDAESKKLDLTFGTSTADGRGNITLSGSWTRQSSITQNDRGFSRTPLGEVNGQLVYSGSGSIPGTRVPLSAAQRAALTGVNLTPGGSCTSVTGIRFGENGTVLPYCQPEDTYNYAPYNLLQRPLDRFNVAANAHYEVADKITAYAEAYFVNAKNDMILAPDSFTPLTPGAASSTLLIPNYASNPVLPESLRQFFTNNAAIFDTNGDGTAEIVGGGRRADELGTRNYRYERQSYQITTGLRGDVSLLGSDWKWDAFYQYMRNRTDTRNEGLISQTRLSMGLDAVIDSSGNVVCRNQSLGCVPVSILGLNSISPEAGAFLTPVRESHDIFTRQVAGASIAGTLFELPAGPVSVALGAEYRKDKYTFSPSPLDLANEYGAVSQKALAGAYDVKELFGELRIPILADMPFFDTLAIEGAARYSDYSSVGKVFTWKLGGEYAPVSWIRIRGAYNSAIRAPNIAELYTAVTRGYSSGTDPCAIPTSGGDNRSDALKNFCVATGVPAGEIANFTQATLGLNQDSGGNPNLREEKSKTYTIGAVISPPFIPRLNITVDYFNVKVDDAIMTVNAQQTMNDCYTMMDAGSATCRAITRLGNGQLDYVSVSSNNIGSLKVNGIDAQVDYRVPLPGALSLGDDASLSLQAIASWLFERTTQVLATSAPQDCAGYYGAGCSVGTGGFITPDFKLNLGATYASGPLSFRLQGRMIGDLKLYPTATNVVKSVDPVWYLDTSFSIDATETFSFFGGVNNLLDRQPPILGTTLVGDANTDVSLYDTLGRRYFVGARMKF
ncbi:TonB-dependent receptor [Sphingobium yanoikuyae]|uniref:TonB-dependent receptor n=1 Tax=Sphingobium yanoikuyae TaxID=13690 RepID=A0A6M4G480_SPHYA|nr:TonB-dependent receptor [Sphingobium yanoikuyae]QJR02051.1 TonB-dependent receptor [Sphingobium yanoikuyae]